jgi:hypothetical protein
LPRKYCMKDHIELERNKMNQPYWLFSILALKWPGVVWIKNDNTKHSPIWNHDAWFELTITHIADISSSLT